MTEVEDVLGEWDEDGTGTSDAPPAVAGAIAALDLTAGVQDALQAVMRKRLEQVAAAALDDVLDDDALEQLRTAAADAARAALEDEPPALVYTNVLDFMTGYLMPMYRRSLSGSATTWCPEWWRHAEANTRLEALWRSWEHLRLDPATGISVWLRDHLDHHMRVLLDTDGPFKGCSPEKGHNEQRLKPLPLTPPPDGLFDAI